MDTLSQWFGNCQQWLFETLVQPALFHLGLSNFIEDGYDATMWLLVGLLPVSYTHLDVYKRQTSTSAWA